MIDKFLLEVKVGIQFRILSDHSFFYSRVTLFSVDDENLALTEENHTLIEESTLIEENQEIENFCSNDHGIRSHNRLTAFVLNCLRRLGLTLGTVKFTNLDGSVTYLNKSSTINWINSRVEQNQWTEEEDSEGIIIAKIQALYANGFRTKLVTGLEYGVTEFLEKLQYSANKNDELFPEAIHYNLFNKDPLYISRANVARANVQRLLEKFGRQLIPGQQLKLGLERCIEKPAWTLATSINDLNNKDFFKIGHFILTGKEIKELLQSTRVSYDSEKLDPKMLFTILNKGAQDEEQENASRYRLVSSDIVLAYTAKGEPLLRDKNLYKFRLYTKSAPNINYNNNDIKNFIIEGTINEDKYTVEIKTLLKHFFLDCKRDGIKIPVLPGIGLGIFMPPPLKSIGTKYFANALAQVLEEMPENLFDAIIFASPDLQVSQIIADNVSNSGGHPRFLVTRKGCLDVAQAGARSGIKMGVLNPGDPSGIPGQFWEEGDIALEEMIALFSTLILSQHPGANSGVIGNQDKYESVNTAEAFN